MSTIATKIKELRTRKGLTQGEVADALGVSRPTFVSIEDGKRELNISELRKIAAAFGIAVHDLASDIAPEFLGEGSVDKYKQIILNALYFGGDSSDGKLTKTKLAKLAYLADFAWYYDKFQSMSGLAYRRIQQGPVPDQYFRVIDELFESGEITIEHKKDGTVQMINLTLVENYPPNNKLNKDEIDLIKKVAKRWKDKSTSDIVDFTHGQLPWKICRQGELIPFNIITQEDPGNVY